MSEVKHLGDVSVRESWESGAKQSTEAGVLVTLVLKGLYADLESKIPAHGDDYPGQPDHCVDTADLRPRKGRQGTLTINLKPKSKDTEPNEPLHTKWEVSMERLEIPLLQNPKIAGYTEVLNLWEKSEDSLKRLFKYKDADGEVKALGGEGLEVAKDMANGMQAYLRFYPVVKKVMTYKNRPKVGKDLNKIQTPSGAGDIEGTWEYLKTGDNRNENDDGTWERSEEWTGAEKWNERYYEKAGGAG